MINDIVKTGEGRLDQLVGMWFHSIKEEEIINQGQVLKYLPETGLLLQLYSFLTSEPTDQIEIDLKDIIGWWFYNTDEDMRTEFEGYCKAKQIFTLNVKR